MVQNEKRFCLLNTMSQEPYIIWSSFVVDKCKMIIPWGVFFHFFKILIFWFVSWIKGQKMTQNDKHFCLLRLISQESLFIVHMRKRKYLLHFFQFLIFGANSGVKGQKNDPKWQKIVCCTHISGSIHHMMWFLVHIYKMMTSSYAFFIFSKVWFSGLLGA